MSRGTGPSFTLLSLLSIGCSDLTDQKGDISAEKTGSLVTDLAPRVAPDADLVAGCGDGAPSESGAAILRRLPFAQQVTPSGALIVLQTAGRESIEVDVTTLNGAHVATVTAETDFSLQGGAQKVAALIGLEPATAYCYAVRGLTGPAGFRTAPAPGSGASVRFAAWGDSEAGDDQDALLEQVRSVPFDFAIHTGDLAYQHGTASELNRNVFTAYAPWMKSFAFYPVPGNHDYETERAAPFLRSFVLPANGDGERWYSFDWGDVHFVALDTEQANTRQAQWLDADLMHNRLPWTIVFGHRPPYSSGSHGSFGLFRRHFQPVLERYQVPLVLSGHDHDYERTKVLNGVTYVVTGGGGHGTRPVGHSSFTAFSEAVIHFVFVEIAGSRLVLHAIDGVGREFDQAVIERSAG